LKKAVTTKEEEDISGADLQQVIYI